MVLKLFTFIKDTIKKERTYTPAKGVLEKTDMDKIVVIIKREKKKQIIQKLLCLKSEAIVAAFSM